MSPPRVLTITTLYPNREMPSHGIFVETRLRQVAATGRARFQVVAPVPWFPATADRFGTYARWGRVPVSETRHGIRITHPRYPLIPKLGMSAAPLLLYAALARHVAGLIRGGARFDLIDAHYFYPDGVAAVLLGRRLGLPTIVTARGTDLNLLPGYAVPRRMIRWAARHADGLVVVAKALRDVLVGLGVPADRVEVLRNGVDLTLFEPLDRAAIRRDLGITGPMLLSVGHLIPRKGHDLVVEAMRDLPEATLIVAGEGPDRSALEHLANARGVADRVRFVGSVPQPELCRLYNAADVLVLASSREGWANVLLEAMACGTPVIASDVWGTPEVVSTSDAGLLLPHRSAPAIVAAVRRLLCSPPDRSRTRAHAESHSWSATTAGQLALFERLAAPTAADPSSAKAA